MTVHSKTTSMLCWRWTFYYQYFTSSVHTAIPGYPKHHPCFLANDAQVFKTPILVLISTICTHHQFQITAPWILQVGPFTVPVYLTMASREGISKFSFPVQLPQAQQEVASACRGIPLLSRMVFTGTSKVGYTAHTCRDMHVKYPVAVRLCMALISRPCARAGWIWLTSSRNTVSPITMADLPSTVFLNDTRRQTKKE